MRREWASIGVIVVVSLLAAPALYAQEGEPPDQEVASSTAEEAGDTPGAASSGMEFTATVDFALLKPIDLQGSAGEVEVRNVEFNVAKPKGAGITNPMGSTDPDMQAVITTRLGCATTAQTKVKVEMTVEFLDKDGQIIDRAKNSDSFKNGQKTFEIKHTTLRWALDYITSARITVAKKQ